MRPKKNPKADLNRRLGLFLQIGLVVSLLLVALAFGLNWQPRQAIHLDISTLPIEAELAAEITRQDPVYIPPVIAVRKTIESSLAEMIKIVNNNTRIGEDFAIEDFKESEIERRPMAVTEETFEEEEYIIVSEPPKFKGEDPGVSFRKWVDERLVYPNTTAQGRVVVAFIIEKDGSTTNFELLGSYDQKLADEAMRVITLTPRWTPARNNGEPIRLRYIVPIEYRLQ